VTYCIDTSGLIDAWTRWYPPEVFASLWARIDALIETNRLVSSEEVLQELERKEGDALHVWAVERNHCFLPLDEEIQRHAVSIMATHPRLVDGRTGKSFADPWVIATAQSRGCAVVTGEKPTGHPDRPKIPDVCKNMGIRWLSVTDLIRAEQWRF
jgi:predicted nucleic acid-binding protein